MQTHTHTFAYTEITRQEYEKNIRKDVAETDGLLNLLLIITALCFISDLLMEIFVYFRNVYALNILLAHHQLY